MRNTRDTAPPVVRRIGLADLRHRLGNVRAVGGRTYNPGWNLVFELDHLLMKALWGEE